MSAQDSAEVPPNHVLMVLQKGYLLNNRLLRPALVDCGQGSGGSARAKCLKWRTPTPFLKQSLY